MANLEHLDILIRGAEVWNKWRKEHPEIHPELSGADLRRVNLCTANLHKADLTGL